MFVFQDYFFDRQLLTDGAPPNDRGCRACGKIGHIVAECPRSRQKKTAENRKREQEKDKPREQERPLNPEKQPSEGRFLKQASCKIGFPNWYIFLEKPTISTQDANVNERLKEDGGKLFCQFILCKALAL